MIGYLLRCTFVAYMHKNIFFQMNKQVKKIKLQPKHRALAHSQKVVPELRINGNWLAQHGFMAGSRVEITVEKDLLTIKPLD